MGVSYGLPHLRGSFAMLKEMFFTMRVFCRISPSANRQKKPCARVRINTATWLKFRLNSLYVGSQMAYVHLQMRRTAIILDLLLNKRFPPVLFLLSTNKIAQPLKKKAPA